MYKLRIGLILVLCGGIAAGAVWFVHRSSANEDPEKDRIEYLIRSLGDRNPDVRRKAESELRQLGPKAEGALREAAKSSDAAVAQRAKKLLEALESPSDSASKTERKEEPKKKEDARTPEPEPRGVSIELSVPQEHVKGAPRFYVRITNHDASPYLVARDRAAGRFYYGRFARFEVVDAQGKAFTLPVESAPTSGKPEFIVVAPGETLDLYAGQDDSRTGFEASLAGGSYRVRFVYDASLKSLYREAVQTGSGAAPLPPQVLASGFAKLTLAN